VQEADRRMRRNRLGRSAVEVTELGFGGGPLGGLFTPLDDDTAAGALAAAWDCGIRYFDTSPHYGIGQSERRIGSFLHAKPRAEFTLSTKVGRLLIPQEAAGRMDESFQVPATHRRVWDFSRDGVLRSFEDSLARLDTDRIDVLFLHDAEDHFEAALRDGYRGGTAERRSVPGRGTRTAVGRPAQRGPLGRACGDRLTRAAVRGPVRRVWCRLDAGQAAVPVIPVPAGRCRETRAGAG
jgi:Aldo/keto reductase family